tara:strand:+ start:387 stop:581 length:195 start_codon:yes stop_codon:yes gene_type:complete
MQTAKQCIDCGSTELVGPIGYPNHCLECAIKDHGQDDTNTYNEMGKWALLAGKQKKKRKNRRNR